MPSSPAPDEASARHPAAVVGKLLLLATGGTIAGWAANPVRSEEYVSAQVGVDDLVRASPILSDLAQAGRLEVKQVAQVDSKDMSFELWRRLAREVAAGLARPEVQGVLITHGTDTMEETAYLLHAVLRADKPVLLTGAMRAANAPHADGPRNLADAVAVALSVRLHGVWVVMGGRLCPAAGVRKVNTSALDAFACADGQDIPVEDVLSGEAADAVIARAQRAAAPHDATAWCDLRALERQHWPWVEVVTCVAGGDGQVVDLLVSAGVNGLVVAATGHGTVHENVQAALSRAQSAGVKIMVASRVGLGGVYRAHTPWATSHALSPAQSRVHLILELLQADH